MQWGYDTCEYSTLWLLRWSGSVPEGPKARGRQQKAFGLGNRSQEGKVGPKVVLRPWRERGKNAGPFNEFQGILRYHGNGTVYCILTYGYCMCSKVLLFCVRERKTLMDCTVLYTVVSYFEFSIPEEGRFRAQNERGVPFLVRLISHLRMKIIFLDEILI